MRGSILDNINQQELDRFCFMLTEREKVNKLRRRFYGKHYRAAERLYWEARKCRLLRDNYSECRKLVDRCEAYQRSYKELSKFLKDRRRTLSSERKKLNLKICWDSSNNFNFIYNAGDKEFADETCIIGRKEVFDRSLNYVVESSVFSDKEIKNIYSIDFSLYEE